MKIYRYMYKNKKIKVDEFEYVHSISKSGVTYYMVSGQVFWIYDYELNKMLHNYIMWSLSNDKKQEFINLVLEKKNKMLEDKSKEVEALKQEIEVLKNI